MFETKRPPPISGDFKLAGVAPVIVAIALAAAVASAEERPSNDVLRGDRRGRSITLEHARRVSHEPSYVVGAGSDRHSPIEYAEQMMHRPEVDLVASYLKSSDLYLEWGAGGSTLNFPRYVRKAYSIDHNCEWVEYMRARLNASEHDYSNLDMICEGVPVGTNGWGTLSPFEHGDYATFRPYVDRVETLGVQAFDIVFVDGRARMACALKALAFMHNESLLFMHDFYTRNMQYAGVLDYFTEVARVLAQPNTDPRMGPIDEPQGLVVLRRKENAPKSLTAAQIQAKYDIINWRYPYSRPLTSLAGYWNYYIVLSMDRGTWKRARNVKALVRLVQTDMLRLVLLYIFLTLIARCISFRTHQLDRVKSTER